MEEIIMTGIIRFITAVLFVLLITPASHALTLTYYQGDGKGTVSNTDGREVLSYGTASASAQLMYSQGSTHRSYVGFFNIFGEGQDQIPEGSTITSATLTIVKVSSDGFSGSGTLYKVTSAWTENTITWGNKPGYSSASGDYRSFTYGYSANRIINLNVTSVVQGWADAPSTNYGWMFTAIQSMGSSSAFASDDYSNSAFRPKLSVTFTAPEPPEPEPAPVPEPATMVLLGLGVIGLARRKQ